MSIEFILPELGENIETADVVEVLVAVGDSISVDDPILEIETDKATFEVPSSVSGTVTALHVAPGEKARVGQVVMVVQEDTPAASENPETENAPAGGETAASGDAPKQAEEAQPAVAVEAPPAPSESRANVDISSPQEPAAEEPSVNGASAGPRELAPAAPSTRRLAREIGVNINQVRGTGPHGRISIADVKNHAKQLLSRAPAAPPAAAAAAPQAVSLPDFTRYGEVRREAMSNVRRKTAQQMHLAWSTIPQVTQFDKADITDLEALRKRLNASGELGTKLTVTAILLKVIGTALKKFPQFNASIDMANEEIVYKDFFNVGVAVDTERGLLVPVVHNVNGKSIAELAEDLNTVAAKARDKKIRPDDLQGACITITNLGGIGGHAFTPIVNPPEVAILGVSRASKEPVFYDDAFYARLVMPLCLSYDHRLIDGADAARFLRWVCETLENPALLAFES